MIAKDLKKIEIIWDDDHGVENEGWYTRIHYLDGRQEDRPIDEPADATDEYLIEKYGLRWTEATIRR